MPENYAQASVRHYIDAAKLADGRRYDNAGHLIGFAAECAIKHAFNMLVPASQSPKVHLPELAKAALKRMKSRNPVASPMQSLLAQLGSGYFQNWTVESRYSGDGFITEASYLRWHQIATRTLLAAGLRTK
jgi:hypothetical protein